MPWGASKKVRQKIAFDANLAKRLGKPYSARGRRAINEYDKMTAAIADLEAPA